MTNFSLWNKINYFFSFLLSLLPKALVWPPYSCVTLILSGGSSEGNIETTISNHNTHCPCCYELYLPSVCHDATLPAEEAREKRM